MAKKDFNNYRFEGLNYRQYSNKYMTMDRINADETKVVIHIAGEHLLKTKYGYAVILDDKHVVFVKDWQVEINDYYGNEVILTKEYFNVKEWGDFPDFTENDDSLNWNTWVEVAKEQSLLDQDGFELNKVHWRA